MNIIEEKPYAILWSKNPQMDRRLLELEALEHSQSEIAGILSDEFELAISRDMVKNRLARVPRFNLSDKPITNVAPYFQKHEAIFRGDVPAPKKMDLDAYVASLAKGKKRALVFGDMHIPFQDEAKLQKAIDIGRGCDIVIRSGDDLDLYSVSKFEKEVNLPLEVEFDEICRANEYMSTAFEGVPIVDLQSNHSWRAKKAIQMPMSLDFMVKTDLLEILNRPHRNIFAHSEWFYQVNDLICAHAEASSVVPAKVADDTWNWFKEWQSEPEMHIRPFNVIVEAHTHRLSAHHRSGGKLFEGGSLCKLMAYTRRGIKYRRPQQNGFVIISWRDGIADLNACREYAL